MAPCLRGSWFWAWVGPAMQWLYVFVVLVKFSPGARVFSVLMNVLGQVAYLVLNQSAKRVYSSQQFHFLVWRTCQDLQEDLRLNGATTNTSQAWLRTSGYEYLLKLVQPTFGEELPSSSLSELRDRSWSSRVNGSPGNLSVGTSAKCCP